MIEFETSLFDNGCQIVAGADEVGRGAFAGPLVVGVVSSDTGFNQKISNLPVIIRDSKKMTAKQREESSIWIKENFLHSVGYASVVEINNNGIVKATHMAYRRAIARHDAIVDHLLVDAFYIPRIKNIPQNNQTAIVKGDSKSFLIAAASILAKVERDTYMKDISDNEKYKPYLWHKNKGYGTKNHRKAILEYGSSDAHRSDFIKRTLSSCLTQ